MTYEIIPFYQTFYLRYFNRCYNIIYYYDRLVFRLLWAVSVKTYDIIERIDNILNDRIMLSISSGTQQTHDVVYWLRLWEVL